jgi:hypothetical protein
MAMNFSIIDICFSPFHSHFDEKRKRDGKGVNPSLCASSRQPAQAEYNLAGIGCSCIENTE